MLNLIIHTICTPSQALCGILVGAQQGALVQPGSEAAIGINSSLLAVKLCYALYLSWVRPQVRTTVFLYLLSLEDFKDLERV